MIMATASAQYSSVRLFVPTHDNYSIPYSRDTSYQVKNKLATLSTGMTEISIATGYWHPNAIIQATEPVMVYDIVMLTQMRRSKQRLLPVMQYLKEILCQQLMYAYIIPNVIVLEV